MRKCFCLLLLWGSCCSCLFAQKKYEVSFQLSNPEGANSDFYSQLPPIPESGWDTLWGEYSFLNKSYAIGIIFQFQLDNKTAFRIRADYTNIAKSIESNMSRCVDYLHFKSYYFQNKISLSPGYIYKLNNLKNFTAYVGAETPITYLNKQHTYTSMKIPDEQTYYNVINESEIIMPAGIGVGIGVICGINFNLKNNIKIGAEFSPSFQYNIYKGYLEQIETISHEDSNEILSEETTRYMYKLTSPSFYHLSNFNYQNRFSLSLGIKF